MIIHGEKSCHGFGFITQTAARTRQCAEIFAHTSFTNDFPVRAFTCRSGRVLTSPEACESIHEPLLSLVAACAPGRVPLALPPLARGRSPARPLALTLAPAFSPSSRAHASPRPLRPAVIRITCRALPPVHGAHLATTPPPGFPRPATTPRTPPVPRPPRPLWSRDRPAHPRFSLLRASGVSCLLTFMGHSCQSPDSGLSAEPDLTRNIALDGVFRDNPVGVCIRRSWVKQADMDTSINWLVVSGVSRAVGDQANGTSGVRAGRRRNSVSHCPPSYGARCRISARLCRWMAHRPP
jgi:hypothetical protein